MAYLLGIDTGGTFTDAVVFDEAAGRVLGKAKSPTTPLNLSEGVALAAQGALAAAGVRAQDIALASLSTTLATNAVVEGRGDPAALVLIGFGERDAARAGLAEALGGDPLIQISGGHGVTGEEAAPLDLAALKAAVAGAKGVSAFAVAGLFAVRNAAHEIAARDLIAAETGAPVTCSHELSPQLGGPKRALTTLLNGRLIGMVQRLIDGAAERLADLGLRAPLMVVKGDGALMSAETARARPIETILSGPAASVAGAGFLTGLTDAIVSDIGGTTTDIAAIAEGRPALDPDGAEVGGWRTMARAAAIRTHGLGGDSEVGLKDGRLTLGPARAVPVSTLTQPWARAALKRQLEAKTPGEQDGVFVLPAANPRRGGLSARAEALLDRLPPDGAPADELTKDRRDIAALASLFRAARVRKAAFTPTDAAHVLGDQVSFDRKAAEMAAALFARQTGRVGMKVAESGAALSAQIIDMLRRRSAELILDAALNGDGMAGEGLSRHPLAQSALDGRKGLAEVTVRLTQPLIGLGAGAPLHYPDIARRLSAEAAIPPHADVANAVGAVVGQVAAEAVATITAPEPERFVVVTEDGPTPAASEAAARKTAEAWAKKAALAAALAAGAADPEARATWTERRAEIEGRAQLVEAVVTVRAAGRPGF